MKYNECGYNKSPYVDDRPRLTVDGSNTLADVSLLQFIQTHINDGVIGIDTYGNRHPRAADVLKLEGSCSHRGLINLC